MGRLARRLFDLAGDERAFLRSLAGAPDGPMRRRMEEIARSFSAGCHAALEEARPGPLAARLAQGEPELQGFAYEGAGLGLALLDAATPWRRHRLRDFIAGAGSPQTYMLHVGSGWVLRRLPVSQRRFLSGLDPVLRWLAFDGLGFHDAFYSRRRIIERALPPRRISGFALWPFDAGVGRRLWLVPEPGVSNIARLVATFPASRHGDLWTGVGEACAFAGGRDAAAIKEVLQAAGPHGLRLALGASFAAEVRVRAGIPSPYTDLACRLLCRMDAAAAAAITRESLENLPPDGEVPAFEVWRERVQERFRNLTHADRHCREVKM
jgi:enediyne biosynthesis protein E3